MSARSFPGDLIRWGFWGPFRDHLDPQRPELIHRYSALWWIQHQLAGSQKSRMEEEFRLCFGADHLIQTSEAYRIGLRTHLEELLLGQLDASTAPLHMTLAGRDRLEEALERKKGVILLFPHAGSTMLMIAAISLAGYPYCQYAARGLAPEDRAEEHPELLGHSRLRGRTRRVREENEDRLPASFLTLDTSPRELYRRLEANELVGIAYDGRIGTKFTLVPYLSREALLSPGPFRLSASTGAAIVPALSTCPEDGPSVCEFGKPIFPENRSWRDLMEEFIRAVAEPWLRENAAAYGLWLAHCRARAAVDDHPFFVDYAPDDRWHRYRES